MSYLYVCEQGASIGLADNRFQVKYKDGMISSIPAETLEMIEVFGKVNVTTACIEECLKRGVNILFYSTNGAYYGRLISTTHVNVHRQRKQADIEHDLNFKTAIAKKIIAAKIHNQIVILRRYARNGSLDISRSIVEMQNMQNKVMHAGSDEQIMGYEGTAAKIYFNVLGQLIDPTFSFRGRSRRPPMDPFNSLISLGYSIMLNEIYGKIEGKGLNPYFGILHKDREKHPTLASDLMEEWRAVLVDSTALSVLNGHELSVDDFYSGVEQPGVFLTKDAFKKYIRKLEGKFRTDSKYLDYIDYRVSFRRAIYYQIGPFVKAVENHEPEEYHPIVIR